MKRGYQEQVQVLQKARSGERLARLTTFDSGQCGNHKVFVVPQSMCVTQLEAPSWSKINSFNSIGRPVRCSDSLRTRRCSAAYLVLEARPTDPHNLKHETYRSETDGSTR